MNTNIKPLNRRSLVFLTFFFLSSFTVNSQILSSDFDGPWSNRRSLMGHSRAEYGMFLKAKSRLFFLCFLVAHSFWKLVIFASISKYFILSWFWICRRATKPLTSPSQPVHLSPLAALCSGPIAIRTRPVHCRPRPRLLPSNTLYFLNYLIVCSSTTGEMTLKSFFLNIFFLLSQET